MPNGRINGKQIVDDTVIKTINGLTFSDQYIISNSDSNVTLTIATSGSTHSLTVGWTGTLPLSRGGSNNTSFTASQILITSTNSIISSGYKFNDSGTTSTDIWSANKVISYALTGSGTVSYITQFTGTNSIGSSGYTINDNTVTSNNVISAQKVVEYNYAFNIIMGF